MKDDGDEYNPTLEEITEYIKMLEDIITATKH